LTHLFHLETAAKLDDDERILFLIFQERVKEHWRLRCVNISGMPYISRKRLPLEWSGISREKLED